MRAMTMALATLAMLGAPVLTAAPALADGIERPRVERPAPRPRPRPAPRVEAPPPVVRESPPVPLFVPAPPPAPPSREVHLSDGFFMTPLSGGVGFGIDGGSYGGGGSVTISQGGPQFSGAGRDLSAYRISRRGGGGGGHHCGC
jgi:hypothetical protein